VDNSPYRSTTDESVFATSTRTCTVGDCERDETACPFVRHGGVVYADGARPRRENVSRTGNGPAYVTIYPAVRNRRAADQTADDRARPNPNGTKTDCFGSSAILLSAFNRRIHSFGRARVRVFTQAAVVPIGN